MALYDHRAFRVAENWWVGEVHGASGAGTYASEEQVSPEDMTFTHDRVYFTCVSDEGLPSRTTSIPSDTLNRFSHDAILDLLDRAEEIDGRFEMHPYNAPDARSFSDDEMIVDRDGLTWAIQVSQVIRLRDGEPTTVPAIEFLCLDDSALEGEILAKDFTTLADFRAAHGEDGLVELIEAVKEQYRELPDPDRFNIDGYGPA